MNGVPDRVDLIWISLDPTKGHEQKGRRSAIVLSPRDFNYFTGFATVCPITRQQKGLNYEVPLPNGLAFEGVILTDQIKNLDWRARNTQIVGIVQLCLDYVHTYLSMEEE